MPVKPYPERRRNALYGWFGWRAFFNSSDASDSNLEAFDTNSTLGVSNSLINLSANNGDLFKLAWDKWFPSSHMKSIE
jgi:hypothetical protein